MSIEKPSRRKDVEGGVEEPANKSEFPPQYTIDLSEGWDSVSKREIFLRELKKLPIYSKGLLFSGFDAGDIGKKTSSDEEGDIVFCLPEPDPESDDDAVGILEYADNADYKKPAIAVYDPSN